jgi:hypothetical protein
MQKQQQEAEAQRQAELKKAFESGKQDATVQLKQMELQQKSQLSQAELQLKAQQSEAELALKAQAAERELQLKAELSAAEMAHKERMSTKEMEMRDKHTMTDLDKRMELENRALGLDYSSVFPKEPEEEQPDPALIIAVQTQQAMTEGLNMVAGTLAQLGESLNQTTALVGQSNAQIGGALQGIAQTQQNVAIAINELAKAEITEEEAKTETVTFKRDKSGKIVSAVISE